MKIKCFILILTILISLGCARNNQLNEYPVVDRSELVIYPDVYEAKPDLPSPILADDNREFILVGFDNGKYAYLDVTPENGEIRNYKKRLYGKGLQMKANEEDFPHFASSGLHSEKELSSTLTITGRTVAEITVDGRPWASSGTGFMADDETIMSVLKGDNDIVRSMGLTHPDIGRALFHIWNTGWMMGEIGGDNKAKTVYYNGRELKINIPGSRGWQESIFNDEILGSGHIEIESSLTEQELSFLKENYSDLRKEEYQELIKFLSVIHTGDMVPFYIMRYGFYEGHTDFRVDPLAVATIFGLRPIEKLHKATNGNIQKYINTHFTINPKPRKPQDLSPLVLGGIQGGNDGAPQKPQQTIPSPLVSGGTQGGNDGATGGTQGGNDGATGGKQGGNAHNIDSLLTALKTAGHHWNEPSRELIKIGEKAVPALIEVLLDRSEEEWGRRVAAMTLNQIRSPKTVEPGLKLLFDEEDNGTTRNQIIPSLRGFDLSGVSDKLWGLYSNPGYFYHSSNIATLLVSSDTALAYNAYLEIYNTTESHSQVNALLNLVSLRPHESNFWYMKALKTEDWRTGMRAMDSIISIGNIDAGALLDLFNNPDASNEIRWRITRIFKHQDTFESKEFLEKARQDTSWLVKIEANTKQ